MIMEYLRRIRLRNILSSFDDFDATDKISERDMQDYQSIYIDILVNITKAVNASMQLRSKKELINNFIARVNVDSKIDEDWKKYVTYAIKQMLLNKFYRFETQYSHNKNRISKSLLHQSNKLDFSCYFVI